MSPNNLIRDALPSDIPDLLKIENEVFKDEAWSQDVFESEFALLGDTRIYRVLQKNQEILGYFGLALIDGIVDITTIALMPDYRNQGLGTSMMNEVMEIAEQHAARKIMLEVKPENLPAISLYQKYGFEVIGLRRNYYGPSKDALTMQKVLNYD